MNMHDLNRVLMGARLVAQIVLKNNNLREGQVDRIKIHFQEVLTNIAAHYDQGPRDVNVQSSGSSDNGKPNVEVPDIVTSHSRDRTATNTSEAEKLEIIMPDIVSPESSRLAIVEELANTDAKIIHENPSVLREMKGHEGDDVAATPTVDTPYEHHLETMDPIPSKLKDEMKETVKEVAGDIIGFDRVRVDAEHLATLSSAPRGVGMREQSVPASQFSRLIGFGSLGLRMAAGAASENFMGFLGGAPKSRSSISDENAERLAEALCRMRGAALKLGQMLSVQDEGMLPPALARALDRVKNNADYMPSHQLHRQLAANLGNDWRSKFAEFDERPIAAASIGQVHRALLTDGSPVAVKIQYPGVAQSISSDLNNLKTLVTVTNLVPRGLFIDEIIRVASVELTEECDYMKEALYQEEYRQLISTDALLSRHTAVPRVYGALSTGSVLTSEFVEGVSIDKAFGLPQEVRDAIARTMLVLTMRELFAWRLVQSDPNFGNYLYDHPNKRVYCIDFGAARTYPEEFVRGYMELVWAAGNRDRPTVLALSRTLGFLTGDEHADMLTAHIDAALVVGEPFVSHEPYDFGSSQLTKKISQYGGTFMKYRLTPPPSEAYSLHRKLAGAFLLCIKLKARIPCRDILEATYSEFKKASEEGAATASSAVQA